jgi:predicted nucleic acid-binding Zn ribbon protein
VKDCEICGAAFPARRASARLCSVTCRTRAYRARQAAAIDLLRRTTAAIQDGADAVVLASLAREAARILGDADDV